MQNTVWILLTLIVLGVGVTAFVYTKSGASPGGTTKQTSLPSTISTTQASTSTATFTSTTTTNYQIQSNSSQQGTAAQGLVAAAGDGTNVNAGSLPACSGNAYLTRSPINGSQLNYVEALGYMGGAHVLPNQADHVYFFALLNADSTPKPTPVYSPGNVTLLQVAAAKSNNVQEPSTSYVLFFSACKSLMFGFQLANISSLVQNAIANITPTACGNSYAQSLCVYPNVSLKLKAGDKVGMIGTSRNDYGLDFAAADVRTQPLAFIDLKMGTGFLSDSYLHAVCPLDYFVNSTKTYLYSRLNTKNSSVNGIPACGATMQDLAGTVQGNWYRKSSLGGQQQYKGLNVSTALAIAHLNVDPSFGVISAGSSLFPNPSGGAQMAFTPQSNGQVNREPSQLTPDGKVYCYQGSVGAGVISVNGTVNRNNGPLGHVDIRLDNATALEIDYASGQCASTPVLTSPATYVR